MYTRYENSDPWYLRHSEGLSLLAIVVGIVLLVIWLGVNL